jgi:hypothetical protein
MKITRVLYDDGTLRNAWLEAELESADLAGIPNTAWIRVDHQPGAMLTEEVGVEWAGGVLLEHRAVRIVEDAEAEARQMHHEAEDFVDQKLADFEIVLDRTLKTVRTGRERLAAVPAPQPQPGQAGGDLGGH